MKQRGKGVLPLLCFEAIASIDGVPIKNGDEAWYEAVKQFSDRTRRNIESTCEYGMVAIPYCRNEDNSQKLEQRVRDSFNEAGFSGATLDRVVGEFIRLLAATIEFDDAVSRLVPTGTLVSPRMQ
ncbi:MAG TPA: hypothetical protein VHZ04_00215 [Candidatus Paceibacterota bacterium]|jgi:hypothetical protein|nr:hypothetical protein [Candidatus Paceibacterota bacterium]